MVKIMHLKVGTLKVFLFLLFLIIWHPIDVRSEIVWSGDFETGNFKQWHLLNDPTTPNYSQMPSNGRPAPYGDGSNLKLVTSPVRQGTYAAKFTVKNSIIGSEPVDCDAGGNICSRRRSELTGESLLPRDYNAMPYMSERWVSVSHFVPSNWDNDGSGFGITVFQIKPQANISPTVDINISGNTWRIYHRWSNIENVNFDKNSLPWQYQMFYDSTYPTSSNWPDGLAHFPNEAVSKAALGDLNKGGWTDWIFHIRYDARGSGDGGKGFLNIWKRAGSGNWVHILNITPGITNRGGMKFDHGVGYKHLNGFGIKAGMYMQKEQVWNLPAIRTLYIDNVKVANENATFKKMSPDESSSNPLGPPKIVDIKPM